MNTTVVVQACFEHTSDIDDVLKLLFGMCKALSNLMESVCAMKIPVERLSMKLV